MNDLSRMRVTERQQHLLLEMRSQDTANFRHAVSGVRAAEARAREETEHRWIETGWGWRLTR